MAVSASDFFDELKMRVQNPALSDAELISYLNEALRDVNPANYSPGDFTQQVLDTACHLLAIDGKMFENASVSVGGVSTSQGVADPERFRRRMAARRAAALVNTPMGAF